MTSSAHDAEWSMARASAAESTRVACVAAGREHLVRALRVCVGAGFGQARQDRSGSVRSRRLPLPLVQAGLAPQSGGQN